MTIDIHIELHPDRGPVKRQLDEALSTLGYVKMPGINTDTLAADAVARAKGENIDGTPRRETTQTEGGQRERGKPAPGRARRTKEEIAEDDAADKADADAAASAAGYAPDKDVNDDPEIRANPENRQDPNNPEPADAVDPPEVAAQDAADEAAETATTAGETLTHDSVRQALAAYVKAYGMPAAQADGPVLIAKVLGKEHDPSAPLKVSDIPGDDQAMLKRAVDGVGEMIAKNPFKRDKVA